MNETEKKINDFAENYKKIVNEIKKVIVGQEDIINSVMTSILCNGHCLLIGVPGLAKTLLVKTISEALGIKFSRIQFTPDLMPTDIVGTDIIQINQETNYREFEFNKGPVFANIILADEINRTPPKTQSALLEAMQERNVTASGKTFKLPSPFFVLATQNPIEQEGTYPLPEAQLDRFMFSLKVDYPQINEEIDIVKNTTSFKQSKIEKVLSQSEIIELQNLVENVIVSDEIIEYAVNISHNTRPERTKLEFVKHNIQFGAGPRASQYLILAAKANALIEGRTYCNKQDVLKHLYLVLRHRIILNYNAMAENIKIEDVIKDIVEKL